MSNSYKVNDTQKIDITEKVYKSLPSYYLIRLSVIYSVYTVWLFSCPPELEKTTHEQNVH